MFMFNKTVKMKLLYFALIVLAVCLGAVEAVLSYFHLFISITV
jgi:hypothetical protein